MIVIAIVTTIRVKHLVNTILQVYTHAELQ